MCSKSSAISRTLFFLLCAWGQSLLDSFGEHAYLVGSVARAEPWRDVDVRMMLDADEPLHCITLPGRQHTLQALNVALSTWGQRATGLPIDFQFQDTDEANAEHGGEVRNALFVRSPGHPNRGKAAP
jgi:hypothetical protein